ncbi:hypothetical protein BDY19DRAFT_927286 [Irpex rosettiformis]|uniref:Uncharacterized protein n=1 Tax=Irpex rosettiformis TaxID=378272 RepID=A0ACB8UC14_9APHY|nr:hypothetical protein BDY19DRAFT_927286 [Irpex rosettiformis]
MCTIPNLLFHLIHHKLYVAACEVRRKALLNPHCIFSSTIQPADALHAFSRWPTAFNAMTLTSNTTYTPTHRPRTDTSFEVLVHTGGWSSEFELPDIGARMKYGSGTVVVLCGGLLQRSKKTFGEQVEWAFTMNEFMFERTGTDMPRWSYLPPDIQLEQRRGRE